MEEVDSGKSHVRMAQIQMVHAVASRSVGQQNPVIGGVVKGRVTKAAHVTLAPSLTVLVVSPSLPANLPEHFVCNALDCRRSLRY